MGSECVGLLGQVTGSGVVDTWYIRVQRMEWEAAKTLISSQELDGNTNFWRPTLVLGMDGRVLRA